MTPVFCGLYWLYDCVSVTAFPSADMALGFFLPSTIENLQLCRERVEREKDDPKIHRPSWGTEAEAALRCAEQGLEALKSLRFDEEGRIRGIGSGGQCTLFRISTPGEWIYP